MTVVAIICEYNPFHYGHKYQIDKIREQFGEDTAIIAIMSGNYTQRGELAVMSKKERSACAVLCGVNLVLELPFPYSASSAEFFASAGVHIANSLGIVDYISFGSESGDISQLISAARVFMTDEYKIKLAELDADKTLGYPKKCEMAFRSLCEGELITFTPNNLLAIEYIKALAKLKCSIKPHTVKRNGADYDESNLLNHQNQSAMAIRGMMSGSILPALDYVPEQTRQIIKESFDNGSMPTDLQRLSFAIISHFRLNPPTQSDKFHDADDGLYNRLYNASFKANDIPTLLELTETKKFTNARIKRAMWNSFLGVTSSDVKELPQYTQLLAMDKIGMLLLRNAKCQEGFSILTKPSDFEHFSSKKKRQKTLSDSADSIFELSKPKPGFGNSALTFTPYIKNS